MPTAAKPPGLTIGRLARAAGVGVETIRYYQRLGLIDTPARSPGGFRHYSQDAVSRLRFIRRAKRIGFTLQEIGELLELGDGRCADIRQKAQAKRTQIEEQIRDLQRMRSTLSQLIEDCARGEDRPSCPIVRSLAAEDDKPD